MNKRILSITCFALTIFICHGQNKNFNSLLWRIESKDGKPASYLFGTIHLAQKRFVNYSDSVYKAILQCDRFYNEVDFLHQSIFDDSSMHSFFVAKQAHFDSVRKTDDWKRLIDRINRKYGVRLRYDDLNAFTAFGQKTLMLLYKPEKDMTLPDVMLAKYAIMVGKETGGLETMKLQLNMIYEIMDARLTDTTMSMDDEGQLMASLEKFYIGEQADSISKITEGMNHSYREIVFDRRNKTMTDSIEQHAAETPSFFAVGAGHLFGSHGIIAQLSARGYTLRPIHSDNKISLFMVEQLAQSSADFIKDGNDGDSEDSVPLPPPPPPKNSRISKPDPVMKKTRNRP